VLGLKAWLDQPKPWKSAYGLLAQYQPGPFAEEIDDCRREMFQVMESATGK